MFEHSYQFQKYFSLFCLSPRERVPYLAFWFHLPASNTISITCTLYHPMNKIGGILMLVH